MSDHGVSDWRQMDAVCAALAEAEMLLIHGEVTDPHVDILKEKPDSFRGYLGQIETASSNASNGS